MALLLLLCVATAQADLKVRVPTTASNPAPPTTENKGPPTIEEKIAKAEAQAKSLESALPSLYGVGGKPEVNPDSIENMWKEGLDAMAERTKTSLIPTHKDLKVSVHDNQRRVRVISDMHVGGCWARDKETQDLFMQHMKQLASGNSPDNGPPITHLVMNGDIWDWWLIPLGEQIPKPDKLFQATDAYGYDVPKMTSLIKEACGHMKCYAIRGNHDDENNHDLNSRAFGNTVHFMEDAFEMNGIWFEHGNIIDMYSTPPVAPDGQKKKGFAYFETRAGAEEDGWQCRHKTKRPAGEREEKYIDFMRKSVEMTDKPFFMDKNPATVMWSNWYLKNVVALPQNFVKTHLRWVLKQANPAFKNSDYEMVPVVGFGKNQRAGFESTTAEYTLGDAIKDHTYDMELLANKYGSQHALARLYASGLENHFKWFKASRNHMLVVTGHTHNPYVSRMRREKPHHSVNDEIVYANSGAWAQDSYQRDHSSYLDIYMDQLKEQPADNTALAPGQWFPSKVQVFEFPADRPKDEQAIPFPRRTPGGFDHWLHPDPSELTVGPRQELAEYTPPHMDQKVDPKVSPIQKPWKSNQPPLRHPQPSWS